MKASCEQKTTSDYPFLRGRTATLSSDLKSAKPSPWRERMSRCRKNRGKVLLVQKDSSHLSAKFEEPLSMGDARAGGRESRENKWLGQGLSTCAHSCAPHTRRWGHRGPSWPCWQRTLQICPFNHLATLIWRQCLWLPPAFSRPIKWLAHFLYLPSPILVPRPHPRKADSPLELFQPIKCLLKCDIQKMYIEHL